MRKSQSRILSRIIYLYVLFLLLFFFTLTLLFKVYQEMQAAIMQQWMSGRWGQIGSELKKDIAEYCWQKSSKNFRNKKKC